MTELPTERREADAPVEETSAPDRPGIRIKAITFSDGTRMEVDRNQIIVFVGPNNAGKSAALKELHGKIEHGDTGKRNVVISSEVEYGGFPDEAEAWISAVAKQMPDGNLMLPYAVGFHRGMLRKLWGQKDGLKRLARLWCLHLTTQERLTTIDPCDLPDLLTLPPMLPLHKLYEDDGIENKLDQLFRRAFGSDLTVNRGAGSKISLHTGNRPVPPEGKDRQSREYRKAVNDLPRIHEQGDGMRAFTGILASVLASDHDLFFIDEPEAFLHPPQANLIGKMLAEETPDDRQLFVATHSTDFLRGALDAAGDRVRVVRLRREGDVNHVTELRPDRIREVWADPILRYSKVFDGLFHDGVVICEGDADCRFYGAMIDAVSTGDHVPDLALVHGAGKNRVLPIVKALRAIDIPVRVVLDFDALADAGLLERLCDQFGIEWSGLGTDLNVVSAAISGRRPQIPKAYARKQIEKVFDDVKSETLSNDAIKELRAIIRGASAWSEAKRLGKRFVPNGEATAAYQRLHKTLSMAGIVLVEEGELEGFCQSISGHGPSWVVEVLQRDLKNDPELERARDFARGLLDGWSQGGVFPSRAPDDNAGTEQHASG